MCISVCVDAGVRVCMRGCMYACVWKRVWKYVRIRGFVYVCKSFGVDDHRKATKGLTLDVCVHRRMHRPVS